MHKIEIFKAIEDRVCQRRGKVHMFETLDPARTALVVVDMQDGFVADGYPTTVPLAREIVPNINRLAAATRDAGGTVIWVYMAYPEESRENWSTFINYFSTPERRQRSFDGMGDDRPGTKLWAACDVRPEDEIVRKTRFSAFIQGASGLDDLLKSRGLDTLLITGTVTNVCCESTARDAMMLNYKTVMVSDGNAALSDEEHNASLGSLLNIFADVYSTDELVAMLTRAQGAAAAE